MHPENVKFGARIVPVEVAFCYMKNRRPNSRAQRPNCRRGRKI